MKEEQALFALATGNAVRRDDVLAWLRAHPHLERVARQARLQKVEPAVFQTLGAWSPELAQALPLARTVANKERLKHLLAGVLQDLARSQPVGPACIMILKGQAIQRWYPAHIPARRISDLDLVIADEEDLWRICLWLLDRGYTSLAMGVAYPDPAARGTWHFLFSYEQERFEADPAVVNRSVQVELYNRSASLSPGYFFDFCSILQRARAAADQQTPRGLSFFLFPTREDCLLTLLVEISERPLIVRDAIDFFALTGLAETASPVVLNWPMMYAQIEALCLVTQFLRITSYYRSVAQTGVPAEIEHQYRSWRRRVPYWHLLARNPTLNIIGPQLMHQGGWLAATKAILADIYRAGVASQFFDRLHLRPSSTYVPYAHRDRLRSHVRLIQLSASHRGPRCWGEGRGGELLLRTPVGVYLATRGTVFSEDFLARTREHIPCAWQEKQI